jgi:hypothetical protein
MDDAMPRLAKAVAGVIADELEFQQGMNRTQEQLAMLLADRLLDDFDIREHPDHRE